MAVVVDCVVDDLGGAGGLARALVVEQRGGELEVEIQECLQFITFVVAVALLADGELNLDQTNLTVILANTFFVV